jgi:hypothetical protein
MTDGHPVRASSGVARQEADANARIRYLSPPGECEGVESFMTASPRPARSASRSAGRTFGRILWTAFKILIVPILCVLALILGLAAGYSVLGGRPVAEAFEMQTWKHLYDLVFAGG